MANEPSWDELFNPQPQASEPTPPVFPPTQAYPSAQPFAQPAVQPLPQQVAQPAPQQTPVDDDPFAQLFGGLETGPAPVQAPVQAPAHPARDEFSAPAWTSDPVPLVEPAAPVAGSYSAPAQPIAAPPATASDVPLTRRELREREARGLATPPAGVVAAAAAAPLAAAPVAAAAAPVASQGFPFQSTAQLSAPAPAPAQPTYSTSNESSGFPFDFDGGDGGSGSGDGGGFGGGSGGGYEAPPPGKPKKRRNLLWLKITAPIVIVLGLFGGAAGFMWLNYEEQVREFLGWELPNDYEGTGNGEEAIVTIMSGDLGSDVANTLHDAGVTMTFDAFYDLLLEQPENVNFIPGNYSLQKEMSAQSALDALLDPANKVTSKLLIIEGSTLPSVLEIISQTTGIPLEELQTEAANNAQFGLPADAPSLEGYLFPATYELDGTETAVGLLQMLVDTTFERLDAAGVAVEDRHRVLTMAALIQREAGPNTDDFYKISRVFQNRIDADWRLESDATVAYGTGNLNTVWTTDEERADASNLYNTYANPGLPIGPIGAAGDLAIDAALYPADGPWFFFVPINLATGETVFSETVDEHEAAVEVLRAWCRESDENASYCE